MLAYKADKSEYYFTECKLETCLENYEFNFGRFNMHFRKSNSCSLGKYTQKKIYLSTFKLSTLNS